MKAKNGYMTVLLINYANRNFLEEPARFQIFGQFSHDMSKKGKRGCHDEKIKQTNHHHWLKDFFEKKMFAQSICKAIMDTTYHDNKT